MSQAPLIRVGLRPFLASGPESPLPGIKTLRAGLFARWATVDSFGGPSAASGFYGRATLLAFELPYSVIPRHIAEAGQLRWTPAPSRVPAPRWRGEECEWAQAEVWLRNDLRPTGHPDAWVAFAVLALIPRNDPPGPPPFLYLGTHFFTHHSQLRVELRYGDIHYGAPMQPLPFSDCGEITD
jgi:hypothetical protein